MLPPRLAKAKKRASRWISPSHRSFVRDHACCVCGSTSNIEFAHVRIGSGAGMGQKPDDWRGVSLCAGPNANADQQLGCHNRQHIVGERTFWQSFDVEGMIAAFIKASPKRREIEAAMKERAGG